MVFYLCQAKDFTWIILNSNANNVHRQFPLKHLMSVVVGSSIAIFISYNLIGRLKRRLAFKGLISVLAIAIIPFYFHLPDWLVSCSFFIVSVINECLMLVRLVYYNEVVPSSVRGFASNLMFGFGGTGAVITASMATYVLHVSYFLTYFMFTYMCSDMPGSYLSKRNRN